MVPNFSIYYSLPCNLRLFDPAKMQQKLTRKIPDRPVNQNESNSLMTNKVYDTDLMLLGSLDLKN